MSIEESRRAALAVSHTIMNKELEARVDEVLTPGFRFHGAGGKELDRDGYVAFYAALGAAFPRMQMNFHHVVAEGDKVAIQFTTQTVHEGAFMGLPATGKAVTVYGMVLRRVEGGRVAEEWECVDMLGLLRQLGVSPRPA